jgi:hypothetical protein
VQHLVEHCLTEFRLEGTVEGSSAVLIVAKDTHWSELEGDKLKAEIPLGVQERMSGLA